MPFGISAHGKGTQSTVRAVGLGRTGVVDAPLQVMRLIAFSVMLGAMSLIAPLHRNLADPDPLAAIDHGLGRG